MIDSVPSIARGDSACCDGTRIQIIGVEGANRGLDRERKSVLCIFKEGRGWGTHSSLFSFFSLEVSSN